MAVVLALLAACSAGTSDFLGGLASRKTPAVVVTAASQAAGFAVAVVLALAIAGDPTGADLAWGALGGVGGAVGLLSIYAGYAKASVTIVAPVAGVGAASIPVIYDIVTGDDLTATTWTGVALGLVAIALVSLQGSQGLTSPIRSLAYGLGGAAGLGFMLLCLAQTSDDGGVWPVVPARAVGFVCLALVMRLTRTPLRTPKASLPLIVAIGLTGSGANAMFVVATQHGSISTAAVLTSMFPAVTVVLARFILREELRPVQVAGLVLALVAVGLIAGG